MQAENSRQRREAQIMKGVTGKPTLNHRSVAMEANADNAEPSWVRLNRVTTSSSKACSFKLWKVLL